MLRQEIPDNVKEAFEKVFKFSKELKKVMTERAPMVRLENLNKISLTEYKIVTNEMLQFE